jgi:hypothetical protein
MSDAILWKLPPILIDRIRSPRIIPAVVVAAVLVVGNVAVFPLMETFNQRDWGALFVYWCFGTIGGGAGLAAIWGAIGTGAAWVRQLIGLVMAIALLAFWLLGAALAGELVDDNILIASLCLPVLYLSAQAPLLVAWLVFGWQIKLVGLPEAAQRAPVTIRGLMIATAVVAISLALARAATAHTREGFEFWGFLAIAAASTFGLSLIATVPTAFLMLRMHDIRKAIVTQAGHLVLVSVLPWIVMWIVTSLIPGPGGARMRFQVWDLTGITMTIVACGVALSAALLSLRRLGFRLTRRGSLE